ncbi:hypothetical protein QYF36_003515 [Acer negundo]|nr:hypothetical protein QYF36_003515 [Acer negundo]
MIRLNYAKIFLRQDGAQLPAAYNKCLKIKEIENPFDHQFHLIVSMMDFDEVFSLPISLVATTTLAAAVILAIVVLIHGRKRSSYHPVGGSIFQQRKNMHRIQDFRIDVARKHKTYRFPGFLGSTSQVLTVDPVNVEYMLKTNFANYGKHIPVMSVPGDTTGTGGPTLKFTPGGGVVINLFSS